MSEFSKIVFTSALTMATPQLVEASAGTGKTYNIQNVYLRLILHHQLTTQQILVVTFTNAATQELRERLRKALLECSYCIDSPPSAAPGAEEDRAREAIALANPNADAHVNRELKRRLQIALMDFDSAAIFTIHGFCKRVLERYAFECGHDPDAELMTEQGGIIREACQDWWRKNAYGAKPDPVPFKSIGDLIQLVATAYNNPIATLKGSAIPDTPELRELVEACEQVQIGRLGAEFTWSPAGQLIKGKKKQELIDISPIRNAFAMHSRELTDVGNRLANAHKESLAADVALVIRSIADKSGGSDAKAFAEAVKIVAKEAPENMKLTRQANVADEIARDIRRRIRDRSALTYDAMLVNVRSVLQSKETGPHLRNLLRNEFKAALIDEFQDTDQVQYDIFWSLFSPNPAVDKEPSPLVFVGDPKQAIYGFRGGDVFTYYRAKQQIPEADQHSLGTNYRSEENFVHGINELFQDRPPNDFTFLNENVPYSTPLGSNGIAPDKELLIVGNSDEKPIKLWSLASAEPQADWPAYVAQEVVRILNDHDQTIGGKPISPRQIAVLVMRHDQAKAVQEALVAANVNATRQANGNIFDTEDARRFALLMQAMSESRSARNIRSALASGLLPCAFDQIAAFKEEAATPSPAPATGQQPGGSQKQFEDWVHVFRTAGERWQNESFMRGFQYLARELNVFQHIARQPDGNRRLSELRHLMELTHQAARKMRLGPVALLRWFERQLNEDLRDHAGEDDDATPRIADDSDAVNIMTVFRSKGLQFPIVFAPTLWALKSEAKNSKAPTLKYHRDDSLILDLDTKSSLGQMRALREHHEENIRKIYVALTRAVNRVYLFESEKHSGICDYALAHLLGLLPEGPAHIERKWILIAPTENKWAGPQKPDPDSLSTRAFPSGVDKRHGHESFSSLATHRAMVPEARDVDAATEEASATEETIVAPIFAIPGGAKLGECWHEIFEHIDFQASSDAIKEITDRTLDKYRICPEAKPEQSQPIQDALKGRREAVHTMISHTLDVPLGSTAFRLRDIPLSCRRSEMEFDFSLHSSSDRGVNGLADVLDTHWTTDARNEGLISYLREREKQIARGFMTGFIDLVFEHKGKFYIVDWKSNQLSRRVENFGQKGLAAEMLAHSYYLQYMIYTVALHGFLSSRLKDYDYDRHFGGVFYLFLRGIDGETDRGVFTDRPSKELTEALSNFFGGRA